MLHNRDIMASSPLHKAVHACLGVLPNPIIAMVSVTDGDGPHEGDLFLTYSLNDGDKSWKHVVHVKKESLGWTRSGAQTFFREFAKKHEEAIEIIAHKALCDAVGLPYEGKK